MTRVGASNRIFHLRIRASRKERGDHLEVWVVFGCAHQRGPALIVAPIHVRATIDGGLPAPPLSLRRSPSMVQSSETVIPQRYELLLAVKMADTAPLKEVGE